MESHDGGQTSIDVGTSPIDRARTGLSTAIGHVPSIAANGRTRAEHVAEALPGAFGGMRTGAENTVTRLQTMPDSALRMMAAISIGLGAGLRLAGAPRLATLAGLAPASIFGFAILSRPRRSNQPPQPARP